MLLSKLPKNSLPRKQVENKKKESVEDSSNCKILLLICMSKCPPIYRFIYYKKSKIVMFKVEKQACFNLSRVEIPSLSNFQKICLYFFDCKSSLYATRLVESL